MRRLDQQRKDKKVNRKQPIIQPELKLPRIQSHRLEFNVELLTPLMGGGAQAQRNDRTHWIRPSAIKGQLRFWWRALHGTRYPSPESMHAREQLLFGGAAGQKSIQSRVLIEVLNATPLEVMDQAYACQNENLSQRERQQFESPTRPGGGPNRRYKPDWLPIDLWASRGDARTVTYFQGMTSPVPLGRPGSRATLCISLRHEAKDAIPIEDQESPAKKDLQEIKDALIAWLLFGGLGARTRKGAGALAPVAPKDAQVLSYPEDPQSLTAWWLRVHGAVGRAPTPFFSLSNGARLMFMDGGGAAKAAHTALMASWRLFRQNRNHPATWTGGQNWGRSSWPEADVIRHMSHTHSEHHAPRQGERMEAPRALLGLPINIHFKDQGDPGDHIIVPCKETERYASPVWLGVARFWDSGRSTYAGLALVTRSVLPFAPMVRQTGTALVTTFQPMHEADFVPVAWRVNSEDHMVNQVCTALQPSFHFVQ